MEGDKKQVATKRTQKRVVTVFEGRLMIARQGRNLTQSNHCQAPFHFFLFFPVFVSSLKRNGWGKKERKRVGDSDRLLWGPVHMNWIPEFLFWNSDHGALGLSSYDGVPRTLVGRYSEFVLWDSVRVNWGVQIVGELGLRACAGLRRFHSGRSSVKIF